MKKLRIPACIDYVFNNRFIPSTRDILLGSTVVTINLFGGNAYAASVCGDGQAVSGASCALPSNFNPKDHDQKNAVTYVNGGDTVTLTGKGNEIAKGDPGESTNHYVLSDMSGAESSRGKENLTLGTKNYVHEVPDPISGSTTSVSTYSSTNFKSSDWGDSPITLYGNVGDQQYINTRFGEVNNGTLNIAIGDANGAPGGAANAITMAAKQSTLVLAEDTGNGPSVINWTTSNRVNINAFQQDPIITGKKTIEAAEYAGSFVGFDGATYTVSNSAELEAYNDALISHLKSGALKNQAEYDAEFFKAVSFTKTELNYTHNTGVNDKIIQGRGNMYVMRATGANASATLKAGAHLEHHLEGGGIAAMGAFDGATITVEKTAHLSGDFTGMRVDGSGSKGVNNGIVTGGYFASSVTDATTFFNAVGANLADVRNEGSFENNGIMNVAGWRYWDKVNDGFMNYGIGLSQNSTATNNGTINVGINNDASGGSVAGVVVATGSTFDNTTDGHIYIGRGPQYDIVTPETVADTINNRPQFGVLLGVGKVDNAGTITIGSGTQNAVAMAVLTSNAASSLINSKTIQINGKPTGASFQNIGMLAQNSGAATVRNDGDINVNGSNGVGIKVVGDAKASASANSAINVTSGIDPASGTRNYAVWAEGNQAAVALDGSIGLGGSGAIGVHARGGATVTLGANSQVTFGAPGTCTVVECSDQIGYFLYGAGSTITSTATALTVNTLRSTLMRLEDGAVFNGTGQHLTGSGKSSVILHGTGAGATVNAGNTTFDLTGEGAIAMKIDGGARGDIDSLTAINLNAKGAIAGQVDGRKIDLFGAIGNTVSPSILTNAARIDSSAEDAIGFVAQYGGKLVNNGTINLSNGINNTGVVVRHGGILDNQQNITVANGTGILVEGADSASQLNNAADIIVNNGTAGIHLRDGATLVGTNTKGNINTNGTAHGVLVGVGAGGVNLGANTLTIGGSGHGIENMAEGSRNSFEGTTINVAQGAGIHTKTTGAAASTFTLLDTTLTTTSGWALDADGGLSNFTANLSKITGNAGILRAQNNGTTNLSANAAELNGIITTDAGSTSNLLLASGSTWTVSGNANVTSLGNTASLIKLGSAGAFNTLTVDQHYTGNNGVIEINTRLGRDNSPTDKLVISGDTSGTTLVTVNNAGGRGSLTRDGIEVITVAGQSDGEFKASNRITAGVFEYTLARGNTANTNSNNWYLSSFGANGHQIYRPEVGSYMNNMFIANAMFTMRLYDRLGETQYIDALTGEKKVSSLWIRQFGGHNTFSSGDSQLNTRNNRYVAQVGTDIAGWSSDGLNRGHLGVMAGYGTNNGTTSSDLIGSKSSGKTDGYSAGVYGTYYANSNDRTGAYLDGWALYNWFDATVKGDGRTTEKYKLKGVTASVEGGYTFKVGQNNSLTHPSNYYVQPVVQVIYMGVKADGHVDQEGVVVESRGAHNIQTRVGVRAYMQSQQAISQLTATTIEPFVEVNWINNSKRYSAVMDEVETTQSGGRNIGEVKLGIHHMINKNTGLWANVAYQFNNEQYRDTQATLGVKYSF